MKTLYYVVLYRPEGSTTWTPFDGNGSFINFFASKIKAELEIQRQVKAKHRVFLYGPKEYADLEYTVGRVVIGFGDDSPEQEGGDSKYEKEG